MDDTDSFTTGRLLQVWKKIQAMEQQIKVTEAKLASLQQKQNLRKQMALHSQRSMYKDMVLLVN